MVNEVLSGYETILRGFGEGFAKRRFPVNFGSSLIMTEEGWLADCRPYVGFSLKLTDSVFFLDPEDESILAVEADQAAVKGG